MMLIDKIIVDFSFILFIILYYKYYRSRHQFEDYEYKWVDILVIPTMVTSNGWFVLAASAINE